MWDSEKSNFSLIKRAEVLHEYSYSNKASLQINGSSNPPWSIASRSPITARNKTPSSSPFIRSFKVRSGGPWIVRFMGMIIQRLNQPSEVSLLAGILFPEKSIVASLWKVNGCPFFLSALIMSSPVIFLNSAVELNVNRSMSPQILAVLPNNSADANLLEVRTFGSIAHIAESGRSAWQSLRKVPFPFKPPPMRAIAFWKPMAGWIVTPITCQSSLMISVPNMDSIQASVTGHLLFGSHTALTW